MIEIGTRVIVDGRVDGKTFNHHRGMVVDISDGQPSIGVLFEEYIGGHNCNFHGEQGYCWYVNRKNIIIDTCDNSGEINKEISTELTEFLSGFIK